MKKLLFGLVPLCAISHIGSECAVQQYNNIGIDDSLVQYRDTLIGRFNGSDIDTLVCEPIDSLSPIDDDIFGGKHYEWRVFTTRGTVKDLLLANTIGIKFIAEGDLDGNGTDDWGYVTKWPISNWMSYQAFTTVNGEWKLLIEPVNIWLPHLDSSDLRTQIISESDIAQPSGNAEYVKIKYSDFSSKIEDFIIVDTIINIKTYN